MGGVVVWAEEGVGEGYRLFAALGRLAQISHILFRDTHHGTLQSSTQRPTAHSKHRRRIPSIIRPRHNQIKSLPPLLPLLIIPQSNLCATRRCALHQNPFVLSLLRLGIKDILWEVCRAGGNDSVGIYRFANPRALGMRDNNAGGMACGMEGGHE